MPNYPHGSPCWVDLGSPDPDRAAHFYSSLFGWTIDQPDEGGYRLCRLGGELVAALGPGDDPGRPYWTTSFAVADVVETAARITDLDGEVVSEPADAGEFGRSAVAIDPVGAPISLWQPMSHLGAEIAGVAGAWGHSHLLADDQELARSFYQKTFSLDLADSDGATLGGSLEHWNAPRRSLWLVIFIVDDVDASVEATIRLGGTHRGKVDMPVATAAFVTDDQEAAFALVSSDS